MTFDTTALQLKPFKEALEKLEGLLFHSKSILLGAGASYCAGLPLTNQLTASVLASEKLSDDSKGILTAIQTSFTDAIPSAHIEDFLSELVDWLAIASRRASRAVPDIAVTIGAATYTEKQLAGAIDEIKLAIEEQINQKVDSSIHERFVQALHRPMRPGKATQGECIDYLVMNYDALIEVAANTLYWLRLLPNFQTRLCVKSPQRRVSASLPVSHYCWHHLLFRCVD